MPALLNLGHDPLHRYDPSGTYILDTRESHDRLPSLLTQWLRSDNEPTLWVINGPGSFSAMRSASVAVAMLSYHHPGLTTLFLDKKTLYSYLFSKHIIEGPCYIYAGQLKSLLRLTRENSVIQSQTVPRSGLTPEPNARTDCIINTYTPRQITYIFDTVPLLEINGDRRDIHHLFIKGPIIPSYR
ncbi:MAG: hypothetical protein NZL83_01260 [Candidatus Absconditabacterales bacterium]|nr:hypothetical protein [Candidatus Absconditabacterales bacterium]